MDEMRDYIKKHPDFSDVLKGRKMTLHAPELPIVTREDFDADERRICSDKAPMKVDEFVEDCRCLIENGMNVTEDLEKALSIIEKQWLRLDEIARLPEQDEAEYLTECRCCREMADIAREEIGREV